MPKRNSDRGLLMRGPLKEQKTSRVPGPGDYNTTEQSSMIGQLKKKMTQRTTLNASGVMSRASRDYSFTKYAGGNSSIYTSLY